jgi:RNA polymerase sigma factor (sigma-70 family)
MQIQERANIYSLPELADEILARQSLAGDHLAFEKLFRRYSTPLFNYIYRFLSDYDQACDILQQVFLQLYRSLSLLDAGRPLKGWLFQVARNRCLDELRRKRSIHFSELESFNDEDEGAAWDIVIDPRPLPEEIVEQRDLQECLQRAIRGLPPRFRSVVLLRYAAQLTFAEIGEVLGMPEATAKTYFYRAKPLLRTMLLQ